MAKQVKYAGDFELEKAELLTSGGFVIDLLNITAEITIEEDLFTKFALTWNYDNQPAEGIEKIDRSFTIGVNYNW